MSTVSISVGVLYMVSIFVSECMECEPLPNKTMKQGSYYISFAISPIQCHQIFYVPFRHFLSNQFTNHEKLKPIVHPQTSHNVPVPYPTIHPQFGTSIQHGHFCSKVVHCGIWNGCSVGSPRFVYSILPSSYTKSHFNYQAAVDKKNKMKKKADRF